MDLDRCSSLWVGTGVETFGRAGGNFFGHRRATILNVMVVKLPGNGLVMGRDVEVGLLEIGEGLPAQTKAMN